MRNPTVPPRRRTRWPALVIEVDVATPLEREERLAATLHALAPVGIEERSPTRWLVVFGSESTRDRALRELRSQTLRPQRRTRRVTVRDPGWVERSQARLRACRAGRIVIAPPWDVPALRSPTDAGGDLLVVIRPSMGFGTGHHASTRLCLLALQRLPLAGSTVVDVGTGSGVLAIAAARLGAARVLAFDHDPDALNAAADNLALNGVGAIVSLSREHLETVSRAGADVVVANLTGSLLARQAGRLARLAGPGGHLVLGGLESEDVGDVLEAFGPLGVLESIMRRLTGRARSPGIPRAPRGAPRRPGARGDRA
jgi:ribosomal protein L11 methyltransferase